MKAKRYVLLCFTIVFPLLLVFGLVSCVGNLPADYSHQGRLLNSAGQPVPDGNYTLRYRLFHVASGGAPVYTQTNTVAVSGGLFDTSIGLTGAITPEIFAQPTWMEIAVNGEILTPRQRLEGAPYAASLVPGAVIQGSIPITRTFGSYTDLGSTLSIWNRDLYAKGGNGLVVVNEAGATGGDRSKVAALQAIAYNADANNATGSFGAKIRSDNYAGLQVQSTTPYLAAVFDGGINVIGGCFGCSPSYMAQNNGSETIQPGDFVAIQNVTLDTDLNTPIMQVSKAGNATDVILGVAIGAAGRTSGEESNGWRNDGFDSVGGPAASGQYVAVAVQGLVQANVGQATTLKLGDWLTLENGLAVAQAAEAPKVARLMSTVDENGLAWILLTGQ